MSFNYTSSDFPFQPFTKIYSADVNQCFNDIKTLVNSAHWIIRNGTTSGLIAGTANYVVFNDSNGDLTEAQYLPTSKGGLNNTVTPSATTDAGKPLVVDSTGTKFTIGTVPVTAGSIFNYWYFS